MDQRQTLLTIAKQYGIGWIQVHKNAVELKLTVRRMDVQLDATQAERLHAYFQNQHSGVTTRAERQQQP